MVYKDDIDYVPEVKTAKTTRMWADGQLDGALCESSVIPFLVRRRKVWLTCGGHIVV